jgi:hypothetical protein
MLVIGSQALQEAIGTAAFQARALPCSDLDLIGTWEELLEYQKGAKVACPVSEKKWFLRFDPIPWNRSGIVEFEIAWPGSLDEAIMKHGIALSPSPWLITGRGGGQGNAFMNVASKDILYTLKMSHRYLKNSSHFLKTMTDIKLLRRHGAQIWDQKWFEAREKETYNYGSPKLNQNKENFFTDNVDYVYDHDELHKVVMVGTKPAYTKYQVDGEEVLSSKKKFNALPHIIQMAGVYEEAAVLALERSVIPHQAPPEKAFMMALEKVCTSITSGWFREFAWENYDQVVLFYRSVGEEYYYENFQDALAEGTIKPQK